jgi:hypothetical protein
LHNSKISEIFRILHYTDGQTGLARASSVGKTVIGMPLCHCAKIMGTRRPFSSNLIGPGKHCAAGHLRWRQAGIQLIMDEKAERPMKLISLASFVRFPGFTCAAARSRLRATCNPMLMSASASAIISFSVWNSTIMKITRKTGMIQTIVPVNTKRDFWVVPEIADGSASSLEIKRGSIVPTRDTGLGGRIGIHYYPHTDQIRETSRL